MRNNTDEIKLRGRRRITFLILALLPFVSLPLIGSQLYFRQDDSALLLWAKEFTMPFYQAFSTDPSITNFANYPGMGAYWRPFAYLYVKALWHIFGPVPGPYRIVGGLIFMTAIYFFFRLVEQRSGDKAAVMSCLALFAAFFETFPTLFLINMPALYLFQIVMIYYFYSYLQRPGWFYLLGMFLFVVPAMGRQTTPFLLTAILIAVLIEQRGSLTIFPRRYLYVLVLLVLSFYILTFSHGSSKSSILGSIDPQYGIWEAWKFLTKRFFYYGTILTSGITGILLLLLLGGSVLKHLAKVVKERFHFHTADRIWLPMTFLLTFIMMKLQPYGIYWLIFCCLYLFIFDKELRLPIAWAGTSLSCFLAVNYYHNTYLLESGFPFAMTMGIIMARVIDPVVFIWEKHVKARFNRRTAVALGIALLMLPVTFMFSSKFPILSEKIDIIKIVIASNKNFAQLMDYLQRELPHGAIVYEMDELELGIGDSPYLSLKEKAKYVKNMNIIDKQVMLKVLGRNDIKIYPASHLKDSAHQVKAYFIALNSFEKEIALARFRLEAIREIQSGHESAAIYHIIPEPKVLSSPEM